VIIHPLDTAPRDGTPFWGIVGQDALRMLWHETFGAFVSSWSRMTMAPGYTWIDKAGVESTQHDHSPVIHEPTGWLPLPEELA
jgi:hypothetical protein